MVNIRPECADNAIGMLQSRHARFLGWVGDIRYYVVDGKAWSLSLGGTVARSDDPVESDQIIRRVRLLNGRTQP